MKLDGIEGKVAIVTGAGGGIGEAYAKGLAAQGARVVVAEIKKENGERVAEEIRKTGADAIAIEVDVASPESTLAMAERTAQAFGGVDFLVNNAAIFGDMKLDALLRVDWDYYQRFMNVNMNGALLCTRACFRSMRERGGGAIVNQSSTASWMGAGYYGLAKLGINGLTHCLARELGPQKIRVNAIAPGPTETAALRSTAGDFAKQLVAQLPLARVGQTEDMVNACLFLLSDAASWITGQILNVDGGQISRL
ncbi:MAG: SDR family oxidoreductase [Deltaproteobacteria bacterium]|nr:MAG: SDR family oxidoreductase [Deltaproteobacteria bacterium]